VRTYTIEIAGADPGQVSNVFQVEADGVTVECADTDTAYFVLIDEDGNTVAAIPFKNVRSIVHFKPAGGAK